MGVDSVFRSSLLVSPLNTLARGSSCFQGGNIEVEAAIAVS